MLTELVHEEKLSELFLKAFPSPELQAFIEFYRETKHGQEQLTVRYLPNIAFTLRFNLDGPFHLRNDKHDFVFNDHILIPNNQTWIDDGKCFSIKFRFGLLPYLLGASHKSFLQAPVSIRGFLCPEFISEMEQAGSFKERIRISEDYFLKLYESRQKEVAKYRIIEEVVNYFNENTFRSTRIENALKNSFVSTKSLQRYFLKNFGLTPKTVYCIIRTRKALESYFSRSATFRIYDFDYYDHSHFYREVKKVVGVNLPQLKAGKPE